MSESGTSLEALETGNVPDAADSAVMEAILREMNASGATVVDAPMGGTPPSQQSAPPTMLPPPSHAAMMMPPPRHQQHHYAPQNYYVPVEEDDVRPTKRRKNVWSTLLEGLRDPFLVACIVCIVSLPVLQTYAGKYAGWAFAVGGQLSWLGLIAKALLAGALFGLLRLATDLLGL
jgi:hypothetical protein